MSPTRRLAAAGGEAGEEAALAALGSYLRARGVPVDSYGVGGAATLGEYAQLATCDGYQRHVVRGARAATRESVFRRVQSLLVCD